MASQARNCENEVPNRRKLGSPWDSKSGHMSPDVQDQVGLCGPTPRTYPVDFKMCEFNRRLLGINKHCDLAVFNSLVDDFFEPGALLTIAIVLENGPNRFGVSRSLLPRFFKEYLEYVAEPQFNLNQIKLASHNHLSHSVIVDCPHGNLITLHPMAAPGMENPGMNPLMNGRQFNLDFAAQVRMECHYSIEYGNQTQRFRTFGIIVKNHQELIPRSMAKDLGIEGSRRNLTRSGIPNQVINFLRMTSMVGPMQELIVRQKQTRLTPQDTLRATVIDRAQQLSSLAQRPPNGRPSPPVMDMNPVADRTQESEFQKPKQRRRRKPADNTGAPPKRANRKGSQQPPTYEATVDMNSSTASTNSPRRYTAKIPNDLDSDSGMMMVGSAVIMGNGVKVEEERFISKLENNSAFVDDAHAAAFSPQGCSPTTRY